MELSLDLGLTYVPKTVGECLKEVSNVKDGKQKVSKIQDFVERLEDEMRKIDAFKRELPLCMLLLNDAIVKLKEEVMQYCNKDMNGEGVIEDFLPLKVNSDQDVGNDVSDKKDWLSSVQLWNANSVNFDSKKGETKSELKQRSEEDDDRSTCENPIQFCSNRKGGGAFLPFKALGAGVEGTEKKEEKEVVSQATGLSLLTSPVSELGGSCNLMGKSNCSNQVKVQNRPEPPSLQQQQQQSQQAYRKQRRSWSPELHRRFVDALHQLGGSKVATPKQIRELMQVEGLTNDEVKSHLQKYRLHIRKVPASSAAPENGSWMTQDQPNDCSKPTISQTNSPRGPLLANGTAKDTSNSGDDSMEVEDDNRSESHSCNSGLHQPGEGDIQR